MLELSAFMFFLVPNRWEERSVWTICIPHKTTGNDMDQWFLQSLVGNNFTKLGSFTGFTIQIHQSHRSVMEVEMEVENDGKHVAQKRWPLSFRDKNQDSSSAWKSAIYSVNNRFEGFSMLFLYGPGHWANRCHFRHDQNAIIPTDVQISSDTVLTDWCIFQQRVAKLVSLRHFCCRLSVRDQGSLIWSITPRGLKSVVCSWMWRLSYTSISRFVYTAYRCCSLDPLKYFWYTVAVWVTCMSDIRACNEAAFWKIPIAAVRWLSAWSLPSSIHLASQTTTGTRAITLGNMFHFDTFLPQIAGNTICRRKTLWCDVPKMLLLAPNCCLSLHPACHGNLCLHLY